MVPVGDDGFYKKYPFFNRLNVPVGTYRNVDKPIPTPTSRGGDVHQHQGRPVGRRGVRPVEGCMGLFRRVDQDPPRR